MSTVVLKPDTEIIYAKKSEIDKKVQKQEQLRKGIIEHWCSIAEHGVIKYDNKQAFVHISNCLPPLNINSGDTVMFQVKDNIAIAVQKVVETPPNQPTSPNALTPGN